MATVLAGLTLLGAWLAWLAGSAYLRYSEQQAVQAALPPLSRFVDQTLSELEARLIVDNTHELTDRFYLESTLQGLRLEFPFVLTLEVRDIEGVLLQTTAPAGRADASLLAPGHVALYESALKYSRPGYTAIYTDSVRGNENRHWVNLFVPARKAERQGLVAKISVHELLRTARESLEHETVTGLDFGIKETLHMTPLQSQQSRWSTAEWPLERHGLKITFVGEASGSQAGSTAAGLQGLLYILGGVSVLFVSLWLRGLRLRQVSKLRLSQMEERMQSDARIATLGEMSTAIAHELNQPLGAISNYAYAAEKLAREQRYANPALLEGLAQIRHEARRGAEVIKSIRSFIRREETASELVNVPEMMRDLKPLLELQAHSQGSRLSIEIEEGLRINCSKALLQQVLMNLARNGLEAMKDVPKATRHLRIKASLNPLTQRVTFVVMDSGHGISEDVQKSLFKPFYTTKRDGLGIGLSLCQSIAERQGGTVSCHNNHEGGASFELELPVEQFAKGMS